MSAISDVYGPVLFAHKAHADMCEMGTGCPECHHNSPVGEYPSCRACHAPVQAALSQDIPNMTQPGLKGAYHRQCLDCHIAWSHTTGCSSCHLEKQLAEAGEDAPRYGAITYMPVAHIQANPRYTYATEFDDGPMVTFYHNNHVDSYGLECKNCHEGDSCGRCHEVGRSTMADSDLHEECQSCHQNNDCGFCHDRRERPPFDHIMTVGWDLGSYHQALRCDHCHGSTSNFQVPDAACGECHTRWNMSNFDHQVTGLNLSEDHLGSECEDCHQDATYALPPICDSCHDRDVAYPDYLPGMKVE